MQQFNAIDGQSVFDDCLNTYGDLGLMYKLLQDNNILNVNAPVISGEAFLFDPQLSVQPQNVTVIYATSQGGRVTIPAAGILTETGFFILNESAQNLSTE